MALFQKNRGLDEWYDGVPEGFKVWFWIRLLACGYVIYLGVDLIIRKYNQGLSVGFLIGGIALILVAIAIIIWDISQYVRMRKAMKRKAELEAEEAEGLDDREQEAETKEEAKDTPVRGIFTKNENSNSGGIRAFARYGSEEDREVEADDKVQELEETGEVENTSGVETEEVQGPVEETR